MKILVAAKHVVDHNIQIRVLEDGSGVDIEHVKMSMNPFDEVALEAALRLKEQAIAKEIIVVSIGTRQAEQTLRTALAMGADRAILIVSEPVAASVAEPVLEPIVEPINVAKILAQIIKKENIQLALLGKQSIDGESNQTGQMLSYCLDWPLASFASDIEIKDLQATIRCETENGFLNIATTLPCVITCDLRLNEPRFSSMMGIMQARKKTIEELSIASFNIDLAPHLEIIKIEAPLARGNATGARILTNAAELITVLKQQQIL